MPTKVFSHCTSTTKSTSENNFKLLHLTKSLLVFPLLLLALPSFQVVPDLLLGKQMFKKFFCTFFFEKLYLIVDCYAREASVKPLQSKNTMVEISIKILVFFSNLVSISLHISPIVIGLPPPALMSIS